MRSIARLRRWVLGTIRLLKADLWLGRLVVAAAAGSIAVLCLLAACAVPILYVQTALSETALDAHMKRASNGVVAFQRTHGRLPTQPELDAIAESTTEGQGLKTFEIATPSATSSIPPGGFQLEFQRETETAIVTSWTRSSTIETSWAIIGLEFLPYGLTLAAAAVLFGGLAKMIMPSIGLRHGAPVSSD